MEWKSSMWKEEASSLARKGHGLQSVLVSNDILLGHLQVQETGSFEGHTPLSKSPGLPEPHFLASSIFYSPVRISVLTHCSSHYSHYKIHPTPEANALRAGGLRKLSHDSKTVRSLGSSVLRQGFDGGPRIRVWWWYPVMLARSRVLQTTLGQFLNSVGSLLFMAKRTSCFCHAAQWPPSSGRAWTDPNLEVLRSDKAERHGSNYKANIYRNVKTCVFSLHSLSSSSLAFPTAFSLWMPKGSTFMWTHLPTHTQCSRACRSWWLSCAVKLALTVCVPIWTGHPIT